jgi:hypothetical protein
MEKLKNCIATLPTIIVGGEAYLSYQAVTDTVAALLYPAKTPAHAADTVDRRQDDPYHPTTRYPATG